MENQVILYITASTLLLNSFFIYKAFYSDRRKQFENSLHDKKLTLYQNLIEKIFVIAEKVDVNHGPFTKMSEHKDIESWSKFHEAEIIPLLPDVYGFMLDIPKDYGLLLPETLLESLESFSTYATRIVIEAGHYNQNIIFDKHIKVEDLKFDILNLMREDLGINGIEDSLKARLKEKV
tara:strand:+ start:48 stop:581 length:534 start_codon:yes stop_codon:yes gene_type:complete